MAPSTGKTVAAKPTADVDLSTYLTKPPTPLVADFQRWVPENTGYEPAAAKTKLEAFNMGVKLALNTHKFFQTSDENRNRTAELRAAKEAEREQRDAERAEKAAERKAAEEAKAAAREERAANKAAKAEAPAKKAPAKAAKAAPAKAAPAGKPAAKKGLPKRPTAAKKASATSAADF